MAWRAGSAVKRLFGGEKERCLERRAPIDMDLHETGLVRGLKYSQTYMTMLRCARSN
jgi:hypothetical protein